MVTLDEDDNDDKEADLGRETEMFIVVGDGQWYGSSDGERWRWRFGRAATDGGVATSGGVVTNGGAVVD